MGIHLMTGFPGFIASQLVRQLLKDGVTNQIFAVVLATEMDKARQDIQAIEAQFPNCKIELLEGDITLPNLGIDNAELELIRPRMNVFWHLAAIYDLAVPRDVAWKVNVHGTDLVNEFVATLPNLHRYMYFSTAFVAGRRTGIISEHELVKPLSFKNYYEETKYEAELLVDDLKKVIPLTIIRPGIVQGHSETGETAKFDGPYFLLNMIDTLKGLPFLPFVGRKTSKLNVVPIDYVTKACSYLCTSPSAQGKTLHITDPSPYTVYEIYDAMVKEMTTKRTFGRLPVFLTRSLLSKMSIRQKLGVEYETLEYLTWQATFDCTDAQQILSEVGISCPDFLATLPKMVAFYNEHKHCKEFIVPVK